jgi:hypothetical protein
MLATPENVACEPRRQRNILDRADRRCDAGLQGILALALIHAAFQGARDCASCTARARETRASASFQSGGDALQSR